MGVVQDAREQASAELRKRACRRAEELVGAAPPAAPPAPPAAPPAAPAAPPAVAVLCVVAILLCVWLFY